jgi:hypothetical protein
MTFPDAGTFPRRGQGGDGTFPDTRGELRGHPTLSRSFLTLSWGRPAGWPDVLEHDLGAPDLVHQVESYQVHTARARSFLWPLGKPGITWCMIVRGTPVPPWRQLAAILRGQIESRELALHERGEHAHNR